MIIEPFIHFTCANRLLSRSTWLITSLSPGGREKMSKHGMPAGNVGALLARFAELRRKALARTGVSFPIVAIQEAGLDGFGFTACCRAKDPAYGANGVK